MQMRQPQYGLSLIELMIAMVAGLLLIGGVINIYISSTRTNSDTMKIARLNQELRAAMVLMTNDIRRAGYWGAATNNQQAQANPFQAIDTATVGCILFSYDRGNNAGPANGATNPPDGVLNNNAANNENFGFRVSDGILQSRANGLGCGASGWQSLTDDSITITNLQFTANNQNVNGPDLNNNAQADFVLTVRDITISLTGRLTNDATVNRTITSTVRVRNDLYTPGT